MKDSKPGNLRSARESAKFAAQLSAHDWKGLREGQRSLALRSLSVGRSRWDTLHNSSSCLAKYCRKVSLATWNKRRSAASLGYRWPPRNKPRSVPIDLVRRLLCDLTGLVLAQRLVEDLLRDLVRHLVCKLHLPSLRGSLNANMATRGVYTVPGFREASS